MEEHRKELDALRRAIPVTRMVDYGVPLGDAMAVHAGCDAADAPRWDAACEAAAGRHAARATQAGEHGRSVTAQDAWRAACGLLQCAQLAFNQDAPRKLALYERAHEALAQHAALAGDIDAFTLATPLGALHGWAVRPVGRARAAVVIVGGLSGWGGAYLDMARALAARGILAVMAEGPGQGLSRMRGGLHLDARSLPLFGAFVAHARSLQPGPVGVWGNSFGGLFAAHMAAADAGVRAACINGAPMVPEVPAFRTAREQLAAVLGADSDATLADGVRMLAMAPQRHRIAGALLVLEGGRDPLVPAGSQSSFFALAAPDRTRLLAWDDGEHTLYNRAGERNAAVADWFLQELAGPA